MKPTTAVIFAAGVGTRMLPITAAVQKELLPILNRPVIDYTVADCVAAGITRIIFVIRPGQNGLKDYYLGNEQLTGSLERLGKSKALKLLENIRKQADFEFIEQPEAAGYGTAVPLQVALPLLDPKEPVLVCGGDDFIWHADGTSEMQLFINTFVNSGGEGAVMSAQLDEDQLQHYGVLSTFKRRGTEYLRDIIEKPAPGMAPSRSVNLAKYIISGSLFNFVKEINPRMDVSESYLTDALTAAASEHEIVVHRVTGTHLDTGNPAAWLNANEIVASAITAKN
jgi:UTP--glucose-1-phosphate uridylyltransferase